MLYHKEGGRQINNLHQEVQVSILKNHFLTWVNTCCYPETTYFCTGVHNFFFLSAVAQKLEAAPGVVTVTHQTVCLFGTAGMPYFGNFWFRVQKFKVFLSIPLRYYI